MNRATTLITVCNDEVSPRFDLTTEVVILFAEDVNNATPGTPTAQNQAEPCGYRTKHMVLPRPSNDDLCDFIVKNSIHQVVCGGIEEDYFHYLRWKGIPVICDIIGKTNTVVQHILNNDIAAGMHFIANKTPLQEPANAD